MKTKKTITFTLDIDLIDELKDIAKDEQLNMSAIAQMLFIEWLVTRNKK
jgi:post-segregation antitoxin (ccd killing protein)